MTPRRRPRRRPRAILAALSLAVLALAACGDEAADAFGTFEADPVVVSAEVGGTLVRFEPREGARVPAGAVVGQIDTVALALQRVELERQGRASRTRTVEARAQVGVLDAQLATARSELARVRRLHAAEAATARQLEQAVGEVRVLTERIEAARAGIGVVREEAGGAAARVRQVEDRLARSRITNPRAGTVLTTYAERGEWVAPGAPLYEVADLDTLTFRAYVSGAQLAAVRLGDTVRVRVDASDGALRTVTGRVTWIAAEAEFTPTPIQTRDERTSQVYAVKVRVANPDGALRIGMPGELVLARGGAAASVAAGRP